MRFFFYLIIIVSYLPAQVPDPVQPPMPDSLFLRVVIPAKDTVKIFSSKLRYAARTRPEAKAFLNDKPSKVYPSGAFVGVAEIKVGTNVLRFISKSANGDSVWKEYVVIRPEPMKNSPHDTLVIERAMMEPSEDMWLTAGDVLEVKFKGSPGWEATFDIPDVESGISMRELSAKEAKGFTGVYVGRYIVKPADALQQKEIVFKLRKGFWSREKATSEAKISFLTKELPRVAEIVGKRPFLNAGLGDDRLGGSKLGFLQPGVLVQISGKVGTQYRVRLSETMEGWLPEEFAKLLPLDTPLPRSLTGAIIALGNGSDDIVSLSLTEKLPYTSEQLVNPHAIAVDVYGATSNTNWIAQPQNVKNIENITWKQIAADQYRLIITLRSKQHWGYDIDYNGTTLRVKVRRPPEIASQDSVLRGFSIAVDAGHGGENNNGAFGATGAAEKDVTISIARHLESLLKSKGAKVLLTRTETDGPAQHERIEKILQSNARILVSIHCNSAGESSDPLLIRGTSAYYRPIGFKPLADIVYSRMVSLGLTPFGEIGGFNFILNSLNQVPNVLVETLFISNPEEEMQLLDNEFRQKIAVQIAAGLEEFVKTASAAK